MKVDALLVSGWACPSAWLRELSAAIADGFGKVEACAALALPAAGAERGEVSAYAAGLAERLGQCQPAPWLIGWSMGGMVALETALAYPERVRGLVLMGASARFIRAEDYPAGTRDVSLKALARALAREPAQTLARWIFDGARFPKLGKGEAAAMADEALSTFSLKDLLEGLDYLAGIDLRARLASLRLPTLVLHAREDALITNAAAECLAEAMPGSRLMFYEKADHFFPIRRCRDVAVDVLNFASAYGLIWMRNEG